MGHARDGALLAELNAKATLEDLRNYVEACGMSALRPTLLAQFDLHAEYADANEWATAVRLCETLAIVGWGDRERVDARSRFTGDCWETQFVNAVGQSRFRRACWTQKNVGWVQFNPEYRRSPNHPEKPDIGWKDYARGVEHQAVACAALADQRNYARQCPIIVGLTGARNPTTDAATALKRELHDRLRAALRPARYGEAVEFIYVTIRCPGLSDDEPPSGLKVGALKLMSRSFTSDLFLDLSFGNLPSAQQRSFLAENLLAAIAVLEAKLKKRGTAYDAEALRKDVVAAIGDWIA